MNFIAKSIAAAALIVAPMTASALSISPVFEAVGYGGFEIDAGNVFGGFYSDNDSELRINIEAELVDDELSGLLDISDRSDTLLSSSNLIFTQYRIDKTVDFFGGIVLPENFAVFVFSDLGGLSADLFDNQAGLAPILFIFDATGFDETGGGSVTSVQAFLISDDLPAVPLPATLPLLGFAIIGTTALGRRKAA